MSDTNQSSNLRPCPFCGEETNIKNYHDAQTARIASLERTIIEADSCYNADCKPTTIEAAELALVQMCGYGRGALEHEAALEAASAWVKVSERLPAEGDEFLAFNAEEECDPGAFIAIMFDGVFYLCDSQALTSVTHWMPLPACPGA